MFFINILQKFASYFNTEKSMANSYKHTCLTEDSDLVKNGRGKNIIPPPEKEPLWKLYLEKFKDPIIIVLLVVFRKQAMEMANFKSTLLGGEATITKFEFDITVMQNTDLRIKEERWKTAGVVVPVFALRSQSSQGVGDFGDLKRLVDWTEQTAMHVIQLLPIYDTTQTHTKADSYPYNSISIYALHPMYVDLQQLPPINDAAYQLEYEKQRRKLNALEQVDYEEVNRLKMDYLGRLYKQESRRILKDKDFLSFCNVVRYYGVFCLTRS